MIQYRLFNGLGPHLLNSATAVQGSDTTKASYRFHGRFHKKRFYPIVLVILPNPKFIMLN